MKKELLVMIIANMLLIIINAETDKPAAISGDVDVEVIKNAEKSIENGLNWLAASQKDDGSWSNPNFPALTALAAWPFIKSNHPKREEICNKAAKFITSFVQKDGGIYKPATGGRGSGGLSVYNTAVCMMVLNAMDKNKYAEIILNARSFMKSAQLVGDSAGVGGFGYENDSSAKRADLSNTAWALRAMAETRSLEDLRNSSEKVDIDWQAAVAYMRKLQNRDESDSDNYGSFGYEMGGERGTQTVGKDGKVRLAGYGSMTYAALEAMIFAEVSRTDPQVRSAIEWASKHWSVEENPGMGQKGLFYYYNVMGKALSLLGSDALKKPSGEVIPWKRDLLSQLIKSQKQDGSWVNTDNQFWEGDPALVTAYALITMQYAIGK